MERRFAPMCLALALLAGCAGTGETLQDLSNIRDLSITALMDVNPTSASFDQAVHPDDYAGEVTGWYFGHAT